MLRLCSRSVWDKRMRGNPLKNVDFSEQAMMLDTGCAALRPLLATCRTADSRLLMEPGLSPAGTRPMQPTVALGHSADDETCTQVARHIATGLKLAHHRGPMT